MSSKPTKGIKKQTDQPKQTKGIVLSEKRNIVRVEDKTDVSDYNKFVEIPPFAANAVSQRGRSILALRS
jgi:hypothetical protein